MREKNIFSSKFYSLETKFHEFQLQERIFPSENLLLLPQNNEKPLHIEHLPQARLKCVMFVTTADEMENFLQVFPSLQ